MFCKNCGNQIEDGALFCSQCGTKIDFVDTPNTESQNDEDTKTDNAVAAEITENEITSESSTNLRASKGKKIVLAVLVAILLIGLYFGNIKLYKKRMYPVYEASENRFNKSVNEYNNKKTYNSAKDSDRAGLDMIEAYLDYYKGKSKIVIFGIGGGYPGMNEYMEENIALIENNHSISQFLLTKSDQEYFDARMSSLRAEWRKAKRQW